MNILDQLAAYAEKRVEEEKVKIPDKIIRQQAMDLPRGTFPFEEALKTTEIAFICECKKASPSRGIISEEFPHLQIAKEYESAGAAAISVLTEPKWFLGQDRHLKEIAATVSLPCLRKDFIVDEYMLYQTKLLGASATLLICSILSENQLHEYLSICDELGLSALVEVHDRTETEMAIRTGARIIGVNNRNLKDFSVDAENSRKLRKLVPKDILFVSENGIKGPEDIEQIYKTGVDAVLIGEAMMLAKDKKKMLDSLRGEAKQ